MLRSTNRQPTIPLVTLLRHMDTPRMLTAQRMELIVTTLTLQRKTTIVPTPTTLNHPSQSITQALIQAGTRHLFYSTRILIVLSTVKYGGMATHHSENVPGNEFFLHVDPTVENDEPEFELSNCK